MIIPVRCFTCGLVISAKYDSYVKEMNKYLNYGEESSSQQRNPELHNFDNDKIIIPEKAEDLYEYIFVANMIIEDHDLSYLDALDIKGSWNTLQNAKDKKDGFDKDMELNPGDKVSELSEDKKIFKIDGKGWFNNKKVKNKQMRIFDKLGVKRYCCKRHLLTHVDLINIID